MARTLCLVLVCTFVSGCQNSERVEIERRNAAYTARKAAEAPAAPVLAPEVSARQIAELDVAMSCTPRRKGWPIDNEACDLAKADYARQFPPEPISVPMSPTSTYRDSVIEEIIRETR